jgi:hypothetical protein
MRTPLLMTPRTLPDVVSMTGAVPDVGSAGAPALSEGIASAAPQSEDFIIARRLIPNVSAMACSPFIVRQSSHHETLQLPNYPITRLPDS